MLVPARGRPGKGDDAGRILPYHRRMLHLLLLVAAGGFFLLLLLLALAFASGWTFSDGRDIALNRAFGTVSHDGVRLEGVRLPLLASLAIRVLADPDDARLRLVAEPKAAPAAERRELHESAEAL